MHAKRVSVIIGHCILLIIILEAIVMGLYSAIRYNNDFSQPKAYVSVIIPVLFFVVLVYQLWQLMSYKIGISDKEVTLSANKAFFFTFSPEMHVGYDGLKSVKHFNGFASDYGKEASGKINILQFVYEDGKITEMKMNRFSDQQIKMIMSEIRKATEFNSVNAEI